MRLIFIFPLLVVQAAFAGISVSGGSDEGVVEFVSLAHELVTMDRISSSDQTICARALSNSRIESVDRLIDPQTQQPVPNQASLVAWGSPGWIQIKRPQGISGEITWSSLVRDGRPLLQYVFHELYRASGTKDANGLSPDDGFQLSIGKYHLDTDPVSPTVAPCYKAVLAELSKRFNSDHSHFINLQSVTLTKNLGASLGLNAFGIVNTWGDEGAGHRLNYYSVTAVCSPRDDGSFVLLSPGENPYTPAGGVTATYIDFDRL